MQFTTKWLAVGSVIDCVFWYNQAKGRPYNPEAKAPSSPEGIPIDQCAIPKMQAEKIIEDEFDLQMGSEIMAALKMISSAAALVSDAAVN